MCWLRLGTHFNFVIIVKIVLFIIPIYRLHHIYFISQRYLPNRNASLYWDHNKSELPFISSSLKNYIRILGCITSIVNMLSLKNLPLHFFKTLRHLSPISHKRNKFVYLRMASQPPVAWVKLSVSSSYPLALGKISLPFCGVLHQYRRKENISAEHILVF